MNEKQRQMLKFASEGKIDGIISIIKEFIAEQQEWLKKLKQDSEKYLRYLKNRIDNEWQQCQKKDKQEFERYLVLTRVTDIQRKEEAQQEMKRRLRRLTRMQEDLQQKYQVQAQKEKQEIEQYSNTLKNNLLKFINCQDDQDNTILHYFAKGQNKNAVELLIKYGADFNQANNQGELPLNFIKDRAWICNLLNRREHNLSVNDANELHYAYMLCCYMSSYSAPEYLQELKGNDLEAYWRRKQYLINNQWKELSTSEKLGVGEEDGYFGVAYVKLFPQHKTAELVFAHRGTCFSKKGNIGADVLIVRREAPRIVSNSAMKYVAKIKDEIKNKCVITKITHTGFSLGGFIAAGCLLLSDNQSNTNAVTFDAPGIDFMVTTKNKKLDIINYVTTPNVVNTLNTHAGKVRRLTSFSEKISNKFREMIDHSKIEILDLSKFMQLEATGESHSLDKIIAFTDTLGAIRYEEVTSWAKSELVYGKEPKFDLYYRQDSVVLSALMLVVQFASKGSDRVLWDLTKKKNEKGEYVGVTEIKIHEKIVYVANNNFSSNLNRAIGNQQSPLNVQQMNNNRFHPK